MCDILSDRSTHIYTDRMNPVNPQSLFVCFPGAEIQQKLRTRHDFKLILKIIHVRLVYKFDKNDRKFDANLW